MAVAKKSYAKSGAFSEPSLEDKLKTQANSSSDTLTCSATAISGGAATQVVAIKWNEDI